ASRRGSAPGAPGAARSRRPSTPRPRGSARCRGDRSRRARRPPCRPCRRVGLPRRSRPRRGCRPARGGSGARARGARGPRRGARRRAPSRAAPARPRRRWCGRARARRCARAAWGVESFPAAALKSTGARVLAPDGTLLCCDLNEEWTAIARRYFARAGLAERITLRIAPDIETVRALPRAPEIDLVFIDADKTGYRGYYEELLPRLRPGG